MGEDRTGDPRGILDFETFRRYVTLARFLPTEPLTDFVEHYWQVSWELPPATSYTSQVLPHPSIHLVIEPGQAYVQGVTTTRFSYTSEGSGLVFSAKFLPGMFLPFAGQPVGTFTDRRIAIEELFGREGSETATAVRAAATEEGRIRAVESLLVRRLEGWRRDDRRAAERTLAACLRARALVARIEETRDLTSVSELAASGKLQPRTLQSLFQRCVGIGPKWVIRRYRMHEAVAALDETRDRGALPDLAALAADLGYVDQAHFTNDFRAVTGRTPAGYSDAGQSKTTPR